MSEIVTAEMRKQDLGRFILFKLMLFLGNKKGAYPPLIRAMNKRLDHRSPDPGCRLYANSPEELIFRAAAMYFLIEFVIFPASTHLIFAACTHFCMEWCTFGVSV